MRGTRLAALMVVLLCGCGLADYEKRMDEQRERLRILDEEATLLGDLIDLPSGKDMYGNQVKVPFEIFLRLPRSVSGAYTGAKAIYYSAKQPLYRYYGKGDMNVFVAWAKVPDKNAKPLEDEVRPEDFRDRVRGGLQDFITREYRLNASPPEFDQLKKDRRTVVRDGRKRVLDFESLMFDDPRAQTPSRFIVYVQQWSDRQAAVIYQAPVQQVDQQYMRIVDISLRTLEITGIAKQQRFAFKRKK
jgi:hypothetical protein